MQGEVDYSKELIETAKKICTPGKGILAADESPGSIIKKFDALNVENTAENRRRYREMLITAEGIEQYISGIILQEETAEQSTKDGVLFIKYIQDHGIVPGIKVKIL
jgi:fructose-bisphosphate aldolase class I